AHRAAANIGRKGHLYSALRKYGLRSYIAEVIGQSDNFDDLKLMEQEAIRVHNTKSPSGYNLTDGGDGTIGRQETPESLEIRSCSQLASFADPGRKSRHLQSQRTDSVRTLRSINARQKMADPAHRAMIAQKMREKWMDPEFRAKIHRPKGLR